MSKPIPAVGRTVHYLLDEGPNAGQARPAVIVRVHNQPNGRPGTLCNLQVFTDGDGGHRQGDHLAPVVHRRDVSPGSRPGQYQWPDIPATAKAAKPKGK